MNAVPLLRNSERMDFRRCPQRWHWRWNEHLVPIEMGHGPLVFGTFGHLALAEYYLPGNKRGPHPAETWMKITEDFMDAVRVPETGFLDEDTEMTWEDARSLGHDMLVNYIDVYGGDEHWEVLWVEHPGSQFIPHPHRKESIVEYCYTMDLIVRDHSENGRIRYIDHKFMKAIQTRHLVIDSQNGGYLAIGTHQLRKEGIIGPKEAVRDLVYNFLRKARYPDKDRDPVTGEFLNKDGTPMKRQPPPFFERFVVKKTARERNKQIAHIGHEALHMKAFRTGKLPLHKNPSRDCNWDCAFFTLCQIDEIDGNVEETKRLMFKKEDPYTEYKDYSASQKTLARRLAE